MKKHFTIHLGTCLVACHLFASVCAAQEFRGLWADAFGPGFYDKAQVHRLVEDCRRYNFNALIVEMRRRGDAFYFPKEPNGDPRTTVVASDFDALAEIIKECHDHEPRIEVHCWAVAHLIWAWQKQPPPQAGHVFNRHREWLTKDSLGQTLIAQGYYLDPGHPDTGQWLHDMAVDIASRYDIDGFHWDYARYPGRDAGYNEVALQRYNEEFGLSGEPQPNDSKFCDWRRRQITDFLRWVNSDLWEIKPGLVVSASIFANYKDSYNYRMADWKAWNEEGIIDLAMPMNFSDDNKFVFDPRAEFSFANQGARATYVGQAGYKNSKENTLAQLQFCRAKGFKGTVFYSYRQPMPGLRRSTEEGSNEEDIFAGKTMVTVDNRDAEVDGTWATGQFGKLHGQDYYFKEQGQGENAVRFLPKLPQDGNYAVYEWHVAGGNRAEDAPHRIVHDGKTNTISVNQTQNSARWNLLGTFPFRTGSLAEVSITDGNQKPKQVVIADAIRFVLMDDGAAAPLPSEKNAESAYIERMCANQDRVFPFLKEKFQPTWAAVPELPWKAHPNSGMIKGTVTRKATGQPIYNAVVTLGAGSAQIQRTEPHGKYAFLAVLPGHYILKAASGLRVQEKEIEIHPGDIKKLDIELEN